MFEFPLKFLSYVLNQKEKKNRAKKPDQKNLYPPTPQVGGRGFFVLYFFNFFEKKDLLLSDKLMFFESCFCEKNSASEAIDGF